MPFIQYISKRLHSSSERVVHQANKIIDEYQNEGLRLTLRQLYYQFVARDLIPNNQREYKRLGTIISDGRLLGLIDWNAIEDRTRNLLSNSHWDNPGQIIRAARDSFRLDHWEDQEYRVEVWIEKEALVGVIARICQNLDIPYFACKGYVSQSEMWGAAQRIINYNATTTVLHLGDHDPSGLDMTRDIEERLELFNAHNVHVERIALNYDQIQEYNPPPNFAKMSDSRYSNYTKRYGSQSWELDALEPRVLRDLIQTHTLPFRDREIWQATIKKEKAMRKVLADFAEDWENR